MRELSLHILDVLQNAREAGANMAWLTIDENEAADRLVITVEDNGRGMHPETLKKVLDPFFTSRTTRHVGLGLPLFAAAADRCNGGLEIESTPGEGTKITATFQLSHMDRAPLGNVAGSILAFLMGEPPCDLLFLHRIDGRRFVLDTRRVREELGTIPLSHPSVRQWLQEYIEQQEEMLRGGDDRNVSAA